MDEKQMVRGMTYEDSNVSDTEENKGLIRGMTYEDEKKDEKKYLILLVGEHHDNECSEFKDWTFVTGRQAAYDHIKTYVTSDYVFIDVHKSLIISNAETVTIDKAISIFKFVKTMRDNDAIVDETSFDITDYAYEEESEENAE